MREFDPTVAVVVIVFALVGIVLWVYLILRFLEACSDLRAIREAQGRELQLLGAILTEQQKQPAAAIAPTQRPSAPVAYCPDCKQVQPAGLAECPVCGRKHRQV